MDDHLGLDKFLESMRVIWQDSNSHVSLNATAIKGGGEFLQIIRSLIVTTCFSRSFYIASGSVLAILVEAEERTLMKVPPLKDVCTEDILDRLSEVVSSRKMAVVLLNKMRECSWDWIILVGIRNSSEYERTLVSLSSDMSHKFR